MPATMHVPVRLRFRNVSPRVFFFAVAGIVFVALATLVYLADARTVTARSFSSGVQGVGGNAYLASAAMTSAQAPTLELHIANDGLTYVQDATVESISGNAMTVSIAWGAMDIVWDVDIGSAKFLDDNGNDESSANIQAGDHVTITGTLDQSAEEPTIDAQYIRNS